MVKRIKGITEMKIIKGDKIAYFDVDDTLVHWGIKEGSPEVWVSYGLFKESYRMTVISENVEAIKLHKSRNHTVVVWSAGGYEWAAAVVKALKLEKYVDLVICKPVWYYDDLPAEKFMTNRKWGSVDPGKQD